MIRRTYEASGRFIVAAAQKYGSCRTPVPPPPSAMFSMAADVPATTELLTFFHEVAHDRDSRGLRACRITCEGLILQTLEPIP